MPTTTRLPIFPLPLVLFPGTSLPLHVFEPRYRAMLADCEAGDGRFGIVLATGGAAGLPPGHVGCVAELREVRRLPDGRSNLLVEGAERFALARLVADGTTPYLVAEVVPHEDVPDEPADDALRTLAAEVQSRFVRVARAARRIADDDDPIPELPADPALVSFRIAALVDFELPLRQRLLASRSPAERLRLLADALAQAVGASEERARVHTGARRNGHGPVPPPPGAIDA